MAIDTLARGLAASNSGGGGGGSLDVGIEEGVGIKITGTDPKTISNDGVTNITASDTSADNGTIKVVFGNKEGEAASKHIAVKGLSDGAFMQKETSIPATASATDTKFPTSKAVASALDGKIDNSKKGVANGVATLDANTKLTSSQLPDHNHASNKINAMTGYSKPGTTSEITTSDTLNSAIGKLEKALDGKQATGTYATGDSSGNAVTANKLANTSAIGSVTKGVYFKADGTPATMTYELNATVPSDAKFTDTTYTADLNTGVTVNNTTYKISNTGVRGFIDSKESDGNGTFRANVGGTEKVIGIKGLSDAAYKGVQTTMTSTSTDLPTSQAIAKYVSDRISEIPDPMIFKGSVGTGGTVTTLPTPSSSGDTKNVGWTYKVITDGVVTGAKVGDTVISDGSNWVIIPSGDEPNGTVTSVGVSVPTGLKVANSPVTTSGTIAVSLDTGYEIPTSASLVKKVNNITPTSNNVTLAGDNIATKSSTYSKATAEADITKDTKVDSAIGQLDYRTGKNKSDISTIKGYINNGDSAIDNSAVSTKIVPENVSDFASIAMVGGKTVKSKNLIPFPYYWTGRTSSDVTSEILDNGGIKLTTPSTGASASAVCYRVLYPDGNNAIYLNKSKYTIIQSIETPTTSFRMDLALVDSTGTITTIQGNSKSNVYTIDNTSGDYLYIGYVSYYVTKGKELNVTLYPMVVEGEYTDGIPYEKHFDGLHSAPVEKIVSKSDNLFYMTNTGSGTSNGVTYTINNDNSITLNGTSTNTVTIALMGKQSEPLDIFGDDTYSLIWSDKSGSTEQTGTGLKIGNTSGAAYDSAATSSSKIYTITGNVGYIYFRASSGKTFDNLTIYPKLVKGTATSSAYSAPFEIELSLTEITKNLPDYGIGISADCMNYVDFESGKYYRNCGSVDLGSLEYTYDSADGKGWFYTASAGINNAKAPTASEVGNFITGKYTTTSRNDIPSLDDAVCMLTTTKIIIKDTSAGTDASIFKDSLNGQMFVYQLATPEVIDLNSFLSPIECESGGTITFVNEHSLDVPNKVIYKKEV